MDGPHPFARSLDPIEDMLAKSPSWDVLNRAFNPAAIPQPFDPDSAVKKYIARMQAHEDGRLFLRWLADLTTHAPYPHVGQSKDSVMIAAAKHEARAAVGWVIFRAAADGEMLINEERAR